MPKLSFEETLRHRLRHLPLGARRSTPTMSEGLLFLAAGAVAGLAVGAFVAHKYGGLNAITTKLRNGTHTRGREYLDGHDAHDYDESLENEDLSSIEILEERVLEAYRNDPILCERPIDIGALDDGIIELTGWVHSPDEAQHAVTIARGTPGVTTVLNRLTVRDREEWLEARAGRYSKGDPSLTNGQWEGTGDDPDLTIDVPPRRDD